MLEYYNAFISYGRADSKSFATKLYEKLTENGLKIWFDQNDIPLGVDFQNQIDDGIIKADNFLFIIAPHSVNSPYCLKEIELAIKYNKRIIPLLHVEQITYEIWQQRNPQGTLEEWEIYQQKGKHSSFPNMHPEIGRINWVYFRENIDNFDKSLTDLIELFNRHQDYVKQHTKILVKGLDWEKNQKQTRYLLIGKERLQAEKWLKIKFTEEQPPCIPTDLHCEFICESDKNANNLMTQVFLAFAEANKSIMEQIRKSLMRSGITVWSSHADIKTGKDFQIEINQGIAGADNLIYLLSPEAIKSEYCQQELTYALSLNKRIIPILISPTDLTKIPPQISNLQLIDFTASEPEGIDKLLKELKSEAVYYQRHKILLVKALKWLEQNRNPSILLRGYNLEQYQSWLELAGNRTANLPTDLQTEFITESAKQPPNLVLDVFVSYSRADSDFARQLNDALQTQGKTTWFDQESIATGTDFQQEIYRGIEQSDNFLFIISPESVNSPYCADEVEYAKSLNKRFVTVLHRKVNPAELHPELAKVQWLDFNQYGGDFSANFTELVRTLNIDREYVREHTKILHKALEWNQRNKTIDLLLRGSEYTRAYEWLQLAITKSKQPPVTKDMKEFILKSKPKVEPLQKLQKKAKRIIFRPLEAIAISILILFSWQLSTQRFLIEKRVLVQAMYRQFTNQVERKNTPPVLLVEIDEDSLKKAKIFDPLPMDRSYIAKIVDKLITINTKIIGFDYLFDRYQPKNDTKLAQTLRSSIEKQNTWFVFATSQNLSGGWFEVLPELASPNWRLQGNVRVLGYGRYVTHVTLLPRKYSAKKPLPFAYLLAVAHVFNAQQSENWLQPQIVHTAGKHFLELFSSSSRLQPLTKFSYRLGQMWLHPIIDFSIPPEVVFLRLPAWELLESSKDQLLATTKLEKLPSIVIIAAGYKDAQFMRGKDHFPLPAAVSYWRSEKQPPNPSRAFTGGEIHAYMVHHFLNQRLVIPIPDLWLIGVAIVLGKGIVLILENYSIGYKQKSIWLLLFLLNIIYSLASLQIYISSAILLPLFLPSLTFWVCIFFYLIKPKSTI
ncbi:MAG: TIR domain-containing protein [Okeania sp. SIO3B5]|uniref:TIR domain-containing protein n=1 Tax=Okeania sp. SIO3B5 TaxID=2607811 RepID=UPI0013FF5732|nr:TIR domain-containing protein [Okeania sp. SIO3B5]NEO51989.1 TIR domain-containing protein [Okeania sp. SIO3B5]